MTTDNALDPPPARRRAGQTLSPRIAAVLLGVVVAVAVIFAIGRTVLQKPAGPAAAQPASFHGGGSAPVQTPPAVAPKLAAETRANIQAMHRAASSPALAARPVQVASVSPPAGPAPTGVGVVRSKAYIGPSAG